VEPRETEERLSLLEEIRAAFLGRAEAGDKGAERIVHAVEEMMRELHEWLGR
jgi:hypothetical protein